MNYNLKVERYSELTGMEYIPYTSESDGWVDRLYDSNGNYVCERDNYSGTTTCTAEGESVSIITGFGMTYLIEWEKANATGITLGVLDSWSHTVKPEQIGTFVDNHPFDRQKTRTENQTPDESWYLYFPATVKTKNPLKISEWNAKSSQQQVAYLGETANDPKVKEEDTTTKEGVTAQTGVMASLKNLFSSNTAQGKTNVLWLILAAVLMLAGGVALWIYRRYRRAHKKAEEVALKYGKYTQDVADALT